MTSAGKPSRSSEGTVRKRHPVQSDDNSNQSNGTKRLSTSTKEVSGSNHHTAKDELNNIKRNKSINSDTKASVPEQKEDIMIHYDAQNDLSNPFLVKIEFNLIAWALFVVALVMRLWTIDYPRSVVFDELNYGKFISLYMKGVFYFDSQPPLGKQLIALFAYMFDYKGNGTFNAIGTEYSAEIPIKALRFGPALFGSLLIPVFYQLIVELKFGHKLAFVFTLLMLFENSLLTQSRFILVDTILLFFVLLSLLSLVKVRQKQPFSRSWLGWLLLLSTNLAAAFSTKFVGISSLVLAAFVLARDFWLQLPDKRIASSKLFAQSFCYFIAFLVWPIVIYIGIFYVHLSLLVNAGPHDNIMTSAFQASLNGGLASIIRGQPLEIAHGSQITLKHTHGRACWLHSHAQMYPVRYADGRGSSHQQQVTCYSFKDVNNWWIVKKPEKNDLITSKPLEVIRHGDVIQLVHGITSRTLNSHNVASPMSPQHQEVSCYIDYNISMPAQNLWKVHLVNGEETNGVWHTIISHVKLMHVNTSQVLKFSGKQYPDWGFNQHEVVTDKAHGSEDTVWNVEEHRHTKLTDEKERERDLVGAEFMPTTPTLLSFWDKMKELQYKMLVYDQENIQEHMFSVESPLDLMLLKKGIAYWLHPVTNSQIHLLGNIAIWYFSLVAFILNVSLFTFYLLRRRRNIFDLTEMQWNHFLTFICISVGGYLIHTLPLFFTEKPLFLHHYLPSLLFQIISLAGLFHHLYNFQSLRFFNHVALAIVFLLSLYTFVRFLPLSYGYGLKTAKELMQLKWKSTWNFIVRRY